MQRAYATSPEATSLLAETQIVISEARVNSPVLPENGAVADITIGTPQSLDVLVAPRQCAMHVPGLAPHTLNLTPRPDATIQTVIEEALRAVKSSSGPQPTAPKPDAGPQRGK